MDNSHMYIRQYNRHVINDKDTKIILIGRDQADVFTGIGWGNRSRYRRLKGRWAHMTGMRLNASVAALLP